MPRESRDGVGASVLPVPGDDLVADVAAAAAALGALERLGVACDKIAVRVGLFGQVLLQLVDASAAGLEVHFLLQVDGEELTLCGSVTDGEKSADRPSSPPPPKPNTGAFRGPIKAADGSTSQDKVRSCRGQVLRNERSDEWTDRRAECRPERVHVDSHTKLFGGPRSSSSPPASSGAAPSSTPVSTHPPDRYRDRYYHDGLKTADMVAAQDEVSAGCSARPITSLEGTKIFIEVVTELKYNKSHCGVQGFSRTTEKAFDSPYGPPINMDYRLQTHSPQGGWLASFKNDSHVVDLARTGSDAGQ
ncbi:hypothetical protein DFJ73DRAFT_911333 [Zopfochytrium polystomum]|nr:hypothetical protein DFJ73DRAFT_911333 [Zopfochytrium polystomum]